MKRCRVCGGSRWIQASASGSHPRIRPPYRKATQAHVVWRPCYRCADISFTAQPAGFGTHPLRNDDKPLPSTFTELTYELDAEWREPE